MSMISKGQTILVKTKDAEENGAFMMEDAAWGTGARRGKAEDELRQKLKDKFMAVSKKRSLKNLYQDMAKMPLLLG